jgi:hypothetical protein
MSHLGTVRTALKRGAILTAANWQVVILQFVAESVFKLLLAVPLAGGAFLAALLFGHDLGDLLSGDIRDVLAAVANGLLSRPVTLFAFLIAFALVVVGGSIGMFLVKGGTVSILLDAERTVGPIERVPLQVSSLDEAARFSVAEVGRGARSLFPRYLPLGIGLLALYAASAGAYLFLVLGSYRAAGNGTLLVGWTVVTALLAGVLIAWITIVNLFYLLTQVVIATSGKGVLGSFREVLRFLRADLWDVVGVFGLTLLMVVLATGASIGATAGLGLIAFIPFLGLTALPLQLGAFILRNVIFQYIGLAALAAYLSLYRSFTAGFALPPDRESGTSECPRHVPERTA